jgi:hypothetical protein
MDTLDGQDLHGLLYKAESVLSVRILVRGQVGRPRDMHRCHPEHI